MEYTVHPASARYCQLIHQRLARPTQIANSSARFSQPRTLHLGTIWANPSWPSAGPLRRSESRTLSGSGSRQITNSLNLRLDGTALNAGTETSTGNFASNHVGRCQDRKTELDRDVWIDIGGLEDMISTHRPFDHEGRTHFGDGGSSINYVRPALNSARLTDPGALCERVPPRQGTWLS